LLRDHPTPPAAWARGTLTGVVKRFLSLDALAILGLTALPLVVIVSLKTLSADFDLIVDDGPLDYQPPLVDAMRQVGRGRLPLWSDSTFCGYPLLARGQSGVFYPPHYVAALLGRLVGLGDQPFLVSYALHLPLAAVAAFLLLRGVGTCRLAAALAGLGVGFAGPAFGICGSWPVLWLFVPWLCLSILALLRIQTRAPGPWTVLLGLCIGMVICAGYPDGMLAYALMLVIAAVVLIPPSGALRLLPSLAAAGALGLAIGAAQLLSTSELALLSRRALGLTLGETTALSLRPSHLLGTLAPWMELPFPPTSRSLPGGLLYAGPWVVLGLLSLPLSRRRRHLGWAALAGLVVAGVLCLGTLVPGAGLLFSVPPFSLFRWPIKHVVELSVMASVAGAVGLSALLEESDRRRATSVLWIHFALQAGAALALPRSTLMPSLALALSTATVGFSFALPVLVHLGRERLFRTVLVVAGVLFPVMNLGFASDARVDKVRGPTAVAKLPRLEAGDRVLQLFDDVDARQAKDLGLPAFNLAYARPGIELVFGHDALRPSYYTWLDGLDRSVTCNVMDQTEVAPWLKANRILPFVRAGLVIIGPRQTRLKKAALANPFLRKAGMVGEFSVFASTSPRPVAFLAREVTVVDSAVAAGRAFTRNDSPLEVVHVEGELLGSSRVFSGGRVEVVAREVGHLECRFRNGTGAFLVVTSSWYPGWVASANGKQLPIHRVNGSFIGIEVPAATDRVVLAYRPKWLLACCVLSGVSLLTALGYAVWSLRFPGRRLPTVGSVSGPSSDCHREAGHR
jgi:hypothetical protein